MSGSGTNSKEKAQSTDKERGNLELSIIAGLGVLIAHDASAPLTRVVKALCENTSEEGLRRANAVLSDEGRKLEALQKLKRKEKRAPKVLEAEANVSNEEQKYIVKQENYVVQDLPGYG